LGTPVHREVDGTHEKEVKEKDSEGKEKSEPFLEEKRGRVAATKVPPEKAQSVVGEVKSTPNRYSTADEKEK